MNNRADMTHPYESPNVVLNVYPFSPLIFITAILSFKKLLIHVHILPLIPSYGV